jgi:hypothetical protein
MTTLTATQKTALRMMGEENLGAILVQGLGWVWPQDIRDSEKTAEAVVARLQK